MCLAVPGKAVEVHGNEAIVDIMGVKRRVNISLVGDVKVGDWLVVHTGFVISKMGEKEARETLKLIREALQ